MAAVGEPPRDSVFGHRAVGGGNRPGQPLRLLFVCKRRPQGRDLMEEPYGRFYQLPSLLASAGFEVRAALLSYRRGEADLDLVRDGLHWSSRTLSHYLSDLRKTARQWRPDWVIGLSDSWYGILAQRVAEQVGARCAIDAYDNYEGYIPWLLPLHYAWRRALARADLTIAAGPALAELLNRRRGNRPGVVAPMAVDPVGFTPLDRTRCRSQLGLPADRPLVGYCGAISAQRGIEQLFAAMRRLPQARLVLSGKLGKGIRPPANAIYLGYLPTDRLPLLLNAIDVSAVVNRPTKFGKYSYPIKLYEAMACQIPVVTTGTPATDWILSGHPALLAPPGDADRLAEVIAAALPLGRVDYGDQPSWQQSAATIARALTAGTA